MQDMCMNLELVPAMMPLEPIISRAALDGRRGDIEADGDQEFGLLRPSSDEFRREILEIRKNIKFLAG